MNANDNRAAADTARHHERHYRRLRFIILLGGAMAKGWSVKQYRKGVVRQSRRETIYKMTAKRNAGNVPCFVCGKHVKQQHATLEHIVPLSKGGTDDMDNLAISHNVCNQRRGNAVDVTAST